MQFSYAFSFHVNILGFILPFVSGFDFHNLPMEEINIIDMSLSNEAVMNRIIYETLEVEHLDFEKQRRANETDIIQHRQQLFHEFVSSINTYRFFTYSFSFITFH